MQKLKFLLKDKAIAGIKHRAKEPMDHISVGSFNFALQVSKPPRANYGSIKIKHFKRQLICVFIEF